MLLGKLADLIFLVDVIYCLLNLFRHMTKYTREVFILWRRIRSNTCRRSS